MPAQFDDVGYFFREGLASFSVDNSDSGKYGFINQSGEIVIPAKFDRVGILSEGLASFRVGDWDSRKCGFINRSGEIVIPAQFDYINPFNNH